jgi:hypothetical protein
MSDSTFGTKRTYVSRKFNMMANKALDVLPWSDEHDENRLEQ